jgi:glycosyltransferase involved in cell wall biosynthesis
MRLLIVNQYGLPAGQPGITRHGDLGAALVDLGHDVTVLASRFNYLTRSDTAVPPSAERVSGVEFRWLDTGTYSGNDSRRIGSMLRFTVRATLAGLRLKKRPDVVLASSPHLLTGLAGMAIARRHRVPLVFEVRDLWPSVLVDLGALRRGSLTHRLLLLVERVCYRVAARVVTVPPHADRRVAEVGEDPAKCVHIPNATTMRPGVAAAEPPSSVRALLDDVGERHVLLYAGAQGVSNDLATLLSAIDLIRRTDRPAYDHLAVVIIGDGGEHDSLVQETARRKLDAVRFHPPVPKAAMPSVLARADTLLVSFADAPVYDYGLSPNKLFDYMAAGRPVLLASRLTDTPLHEADAGRCFVPGSPQSLSRELLALMAVPADERAAMGDRGRQLVRRRYTVAATAAQLDSLLSSLVAKVP